MLRPSHFLVGFQWQHQPTPNTNSTRSFRNQRFEDAEFMAMDDPKLFIYRLWVIKQQVDVDLDNLLEQFSMEMKGVREKKEIRSQYLLQFEELRLQYFRQMSEVDPRLIDEPHCDVIYSKISRFLLRHEEMDPAKYHAAIVSVQNDVAVQSSSAPVAADAVSVSDCIQSVFVHDSVTDGTSGLVQSSALVIDQGDSALVRPGLRKRRRALSPLVPAGSLTLIHYSVEVVFLFQHSIPPSSFFPVHELMSQRGSVPCRTDDVSLAGAQARLLPRYRSRSGCSDGHRDRLVPLHSKWD
jgi:hypothetical protein